MARKIRTTKTPKWLSVLRKMWTYLGNGGIISAYIGEALTDHQMVQIMIWYNFIGFMIQTLCDTYFVKEKEDRFPTEAKNLRE